MSKITLITPPDFYENSNPSILLIGLTEAEQDASSDWLGKSNLTQDINLYYYQGEDTIEWLFYAVARSDYVYINADYDSPIVSLFLSYFASRSNVFWSTNTEHRRQMLSYISGRFVNTVEDFLEGAFSE